MRSNMTSNTSTMSKLAIALGTIALLGIGGTTASRADSNDGGPYNVTPQGRGFVWSTPWVHPESASPRRAQPLRRAPAPNAYEAYGRAFDAIPGPGTREDFPTGAQGGR
jgi:hypothetical protein